MQDYRALAAWESGGSEGDYERAALKLLDEGQIFLAHDLAQQGLRRHPASLKLRQLSALALLETGAVDEAKRIVQPLVERVIVDKAPYRRFYSRLRELVEHLPEDGTGDSSEEGIERVVRLAEALDAVLGKRGAAEGDGPDAQSLDLLGRIYRDVWRQSGLQEDLERAADLYLESFRRRPEFETGVNAASLAWLAGRHEIGEELAREVLDLADLRAEAEELMAAEDSAPEEPERDEAAVAADYRREASVAIAALLVGDSARAAEALTRAIARAGERYTLTVATRRALAILAAGGLGVAPEILDLLRPPTVVAFAGHMLDQPGADRPRFWPTLEGPVKAEIQRRLDRLDARIGYSAAACGADLLFVEAMLERGAEVHIVLPFEVEDFVASSVRYAGARWEMRFRNALKLAHSVTLATEERYLGHEQLFRFGSQVLHGLALLRARFLGTNPYLLALWNMEPGSLVGGTADVIDHWGDPRTLQIIDLEMLAEDHQEEAPPAPVVAKAKRRAGAGRSQKGPGRVIRSMLFADLAGFSKLREEHIPAFLEFLKRLEKGLARAVPTPESINTWGDAIFAVAPSAAALADYALALKELVPGISGRLDGLPGPINVRVSLHTGPVYESADAFSGRKNFFGGHINRAARLEPVTVIGHVYATQQFVAYLTAEQAARASEAEAAGETLADPYLFQYVGVMSLAKNFGQTPVYHLLRRPAAQSAVRQPVAAD